MLCRSFGSSLEVTVNKGRNVIVVVATFGGLLAETTFIDDVLQESVLLWANLLENVWQHILQLLGLWGSDHREEVLSHGERNCGSAEMDNRVVVFEHVHFFNVLEWLHAELLDSGLELLVLVDDTLSGVV